MAVWLAGVGEPGSIANVCWYAARMINLFHSNVCYYLELKTSELFFCAARRSHPQIAYLRRNVIGHRTHNTLVAGHLFFDGLAGE
jgi:hypothetical protein